MPARRPSTPLIAALAAALALAAVLALVRADPAGASPGGPGDPMPTDGRPLTAGVEVGGVGTATGTPDVLRVTVGVEVVADAVDPALSRADDAARRVIAALRDAGVAGKDVQTSNVSVSPRYADDGTQVTGYAARHDLSVTLRDIGSAGTVIAAVADAGGDAVRIEGLSYALEDDAAVQERARAAAFADAERRARQYADLVGRRLGDVLSVRENVSTPAPQPYATADSAAASGGAVALEPGSATVTVTAEVRWSLR
jgi:uncharacterized protein YggE